MRAPSSQPILFRVDSASDGPENMAEDIRLLEAAEHGYGGCRVYRWNSPWITLGRYQQPERDLVPGSVIPWIVRPTGGKAVLHGHDVTVGFAMPLAALAELADVDTSALERSVKTVYRLMASPLIRALQASGLPAALGEDTPFAGRGPRVADCFAHVSANDIVHEHTGQKVCGCALKVTRAAVLVQASIPSGVPSVDPSTVIVGGKLAGSVKWRDMEFAHNLHQSVSQV